MKSEINNEKKAKFFALYWGQEVLKEDDSSCYYFVRDGNSQDSDGNVSSKMYLELKPLSSIGEEDIVGLARIVGVSEEDINSGLKPDFRDGLSELLEEEFYPSVIVDYLRSKGYALPWMGLSVEEMLELGWIKLVS